MAAAAATEIKSFFMFALKASCKSSLVQSYVTQLAIGEIEKGPPRDFKRDWWTWKGASTRRPNRKKKVPSASSLRD